MAADHGQNGMAFVENILKMYRTGDQHVRALAASIRNIDHLLCSIALRAELATVPTKVLEQWAAKGAPLPGDEFVYPANDSKGNHLKAIEYKELDQRSMGKFRSSPRTDNERNSEIRGGL
jgi:transaldolase